MYYYDKDGKIYKKVNNKEYQNVGVYIDENGAITYSPGVIVSDIVPLGKVATIHELIAKFHVDKDTPLKQLSRRNMKSTK